MVWIGRQSNDIVRPNGDVAVRASASNFVCHVLMLLKVDDESGQILSIDEYYNKHWEDGIAEERYIEMVGASIKANV